MKNIRNSFFLDFKGVNFVKKSQNFDDLYLKILFSNIFDMFGCRSYKTSPQSTFETTKYSTSKEPAQRN